MSICLCAGQPFFAELAVAVLGVDHMEYNMEYRSDFTSSSELLRDPCVVIIEESTLLVALSSADFVSHRVASKKKGGTPLRSPGRLLMVVVFTLV